MVYPETLVFLQMGGGIGGPTYLVCHNIYKYKRKLVIGPLFGMGGTKCHLIHVNCFYRDHWLNAPIYIQENGAAKKQSGCGYIPKSHCINVLILDTCKLEWMGLSDNLYNQFCINNSYILHTRHNCKIPPGDINAHS